MWQNVLQISSLSLPSGILGPTVFLPLGTLCALFVFWYFMRNDGFTFVKTFDLFFITLAIIVLGILLIPLFWPLKIIFLAAIFLGINYFLSYLWHWSYFRILDNWSLAICFFLVFYFLNLSEAVASFLTLFAAVYLFLFFVLLYIKRRFSSSYSAGLFLGVSGITIGYPATVFLVSYAVILLVWRKRKQLSYGVK